VDILKDNGKTKGQEIVLKPFGLWLLSRNVFGRYLEHLGIKNYKKARESSKVAIPRVIPLLEQIGQSFEGRRPQQECFLPGPSGFRIISGPLNAL
jgi:hypothetical protein